MASPERNFGERNGERVRNVGVVIAVIGLLPVLGGLLVPGVGLAAGGEIVRRVSKPKDR